MPLHPMCLYCWGSNPGLFILGRDSAKRTTTPAAQTPAYLIYPGYLIYDPCERVFRLAPPPRVAIHRLRHTDLKSIGKKAECKVNK